MTYTLLEISQILDNCNTLTDIEEVSVSLEYLTDSDPYFQPFRRRIQHLINLKIDLL